jgi:hypothetical protein
MAVETCCPACGAAYCFTNDLTGREVQCDECGTAFVIGLSTSNTKSNDGSNVVEGITTAAGQMQTTAPRLHPRVNDEDEPISRLSLPKSGGGSWVGPIIVLLAIVLLGGGYLFISIWGYSGGYSKEKAAMVNVRT